MSSLLLMKYITSILTVVIAFLGSWFFEFTKSDGDTGKRKLTPVGRRAFAASIITLILAATSTIWADRQAALNETAAKARSEAEASATERERRTAESFREKYEKNREDTEKLLRFIQEKVSYLSPSDQQTARQIVAQLNSADDYKQQYPDLYKRMTEARTFDQLADSVNEALRLNVEKRISKAIECQSIPLRSWSNTVFKTGHVFLTTKPSRDISFMVTANGVQFTLSDLSGTGDLQNGYTIAFSDGSESPKLLCSAFKTSSSCKEDTSTSPAAKSAYEMAQKKTISGIRVGQNSFSIDSDAAKLVQTTFSCVLP